MLTSKMYLCIDDYLPTEGEWLDCPNCKLKPKSWIFDNGRCTACGCGKNMYDHFSIRAESIMSFYKRKGNTIGYDRDELRKNWNHWALTGEVLFQHASLRSDGRW